MKTKSSLLLLLAFVLISFNINAQDVDAQDFEGASCTSIMVGKKASTDGSVITSHTCDGMYRTWVRWEQAQDYEKGSTQKLGLWAGKLAFNHPTTKERLVFVAMPDDTAAPWDKFNLEKYLDR